MRLGVMLAIAGVLGGCFESQLFECGDDRVCPVGYACTPSHTCLSPAEVTACDGLADGAPCLIDGLDGTCREGGCLLAFCGNGVLDQGEVCDDGNQASGDGCNGTCTSDESCGNGFVEIDEACDCGDVAHPGPARCMGTFNGDAICSATCTLRRCGDGTLDPGEVCDDGNPIAGDGCNFDCTSDETCGNGILDYFAGEQCDDGGLLGLDGCSSSCLGEQQSWKRTQPAAPPVTQRCAMTYDIARDRLVAIAGPACQETWEFHDGTWSQRQPLASPTNRIRMQLAYDAKRARVVMFGGQASQTPLADTWEYDGITWTLRTFATNPPPRMRAAMAYDPKRHVIVLNGGFDGGGQYNDTWEYDGSAWTQRSPAAPPLGRHGSSMAYDAKRGRMVLFGGFRGGAGATIFDETWEYDGTAWTQVTPTASPPARESAMMAFDTSRGKMILFGGASSSGTPLQDTWEYDGTTWTDLSATTPPAARRDGGMAYVMGTRQHVVLFGGGTVSVTYGETVELVGSSWTAVPANTTPSLRFEHALAYDAKRGRVVLFGGSTGSAETWELDEDGLWWLRAPTASPPGRSGAAMAFDAAHGTIVLFGGRSSGELADTWVYDGTTWTDVSPVTSPPARTVASMVYDPVRGRVVMFGGRTTPSGTTVHLGDTWEWDGSSWTQRALTTSPAPRGNAAMTYDLANDRIVLYGGRIGTGTLTADGWGLGSSATTWTPLSTTAGPPVNRSMQLLTYDVSRGRVVLISGTSFEQDPAETWELEPTTWTQRAPIGTLPSRSLSAIAYDEVQRRIVVFGGIGTTTMNDTWSLGFTANARSEVCSSGIDTDGDGAAGCADSECWPVCTPMCPPSEAAGTCPSTPACGDGMCGGVENCRSCAVDCAVGGAGCPVMCGDSWCDAPETGGTCPGDCN